MTGCCAHRERAASRDTCRHVRQTRGRQHTGKRSGDRLDDVGERCQHQRAACLACCVVSWQTTDDAGKILPVRDSTCDTVRHQSGQQECTKLSRIDSLLHQATAVNAAKALWPKRDCGARPLKGKTACAPPHQRHAFSMFQITHAGCVLRLCVHAEDVYAAEIVNLCGTCMWHSMLYYLPRLDESGSNTSTCQRRRRRRYRYT